MTAHDESFVVDLAETVSLHHGDGFVLTDGRLIIVIAAPEALMRVTGDLPRLAWHIGNRHAPCQIEAAALILQTDKVLRGMLEGLGADVTDVTAPFAPDGGAYGHGRTLGHSGAGHSHAHVHGSADAHNEFSVDDLTVHMELLEKDRRRSQNPLFNLFATLKRLTTPAPWKGPADRAALRDRLRWLAVATIRRSSFLPPVTHHVEHGDMLKLAGREWFVQHTTGHTADHICLHDPETGAFMSGDHVLPSITPHIGGVSYLPDPLKSFFYSLDRVGEIQNVKLALPAHGHPFTNLKERAQSIKAHHHERLEEIDKIARELGRADVNSFMKRLFRERSWGDMAESETYAHLEHLRMAGKAAAHRNEQGRLVYEL